MQPVRTVQPGKKDGFEKLVLPPGHREIVRALVKTHARKVGTDSKTKATPVQREFDLVKGKGKGLTILLHGPASARCRRPSVSPRTRGDLFSP